MRFVLPIVCVVLSGALVHAESTAELLDQLKSATRAELKELQKNPDAQTQQRVFQLQQILGQLSLEDNPFMGISAARSVEAIGLSSSSDKVTELSQKLAKQLREEKEKKDADQIEAMQKGLADALRTGLHGTSAKDLDGPLKTVNDLLEKPDPNTYGYGRTNPKLTNLFNTGRQVAEVLREWQDYLAGIYSDNSSSSRSRLQNLLNNSRDFSTLMPRSEFLELLAKARQASSNNPEKKPFSVEDVDAKAKEILGQIHTLAEVEDGLKKLDALAAQRDRSSGLSSNFLSNTQNTLRYIHRVYNELQNGLASNISVSTITANYGSNDGDGVAALRSQLLLYALQRILGMEGQMEAKPGENASNYLNRVATAAKEKSDWTLLSKTVDVAQTLNIGTTSHLNDRTALTNFLAGVNQERARQYSFAVSSFEAALKSGSQLISAEMIGEHLDNIRKEHPEEFEKGIQMTLNPPVTSSYMDPRYRMMPPAYMPTGQPAPAPPASLTVPPAPKPPATPAPTKAPETK